MAAKRRAHRDLSKLKEKERRIWSESAPSWQRYSAQWMAMTREVSEAIVSAARIESGMSVLDLASGTGEPALTIARKVGPRGHVLATDFSSGMLCFAEATARELGLPNIEFAIADSENLPFEDRDFDAVTCRFGINLFAEPKRAVTGVFRVLKPSGRVALAVWGLPEDNPYLTFFFSPLKKYVVAKKHLKTVVLALEDPQMYKLSKSGVLRRLLERGGFVRIEEESLPVRLPWPGPPEEVLEWYLDDEENREIIRRIPSVKRGRATDEILENLRGYYNGREVVFPGMMVLASGVRGKN